MNNDRADVRIVTFAQPFRNNFFSTHFWVSEVTLFVNSFQFLSTWSSGPNQSSSSLTSLPDQRSTMPFNDIDLLLLEFSRNFTDLSAL